MTIDTALETAEEHIKRINAEHPPVELPTENETDEDDEE